MNTWVRVPDLVVAIVIVIDVKNVDAKNKKR